VAFSPFSQGYIPHNAILDENRVVQYTRYGFYQAEIRNKLTELSDPLVKFDHVPLMNTENDSSPYDITCDIRSSGNIVSGSAAIYWNTDGGSTFAMDPLVNSSGDTYTGSIVNKPHGTTVYYYLHAEADNGFQGSDPLGAPEILHEFDVLQDTNPPQISHDPITDWRAAKWGPTIETDITDDLPIDSASVEYMINGGSAMDAPMTQGTDGLWTADLAGSVSVGDTVSYRIIATDTAMSPHTSYMPASGYYDINVIDYLEALVIDLDLNVNSGPVVQSTLQGLGIDVDYVTEIPKYPGLYSTLWICLGVQPHNTSLGFDPCMTLNEYILDGGYVYLEGGNAWNNDTRYPFQLQFSIGTTGQGDADTGTIVGEAGSFAEGMSFNYIGDNNNMDRLKVKSGAFGIFNNESPEYVNGVGKDGGSYKTIGTSFEFSGLEDGSGASTKDKLMTEYAVFFDLMSAPPTPTPPPPPTPTPPPTDELGVTLWMPDTEFQPGEPCSCKVTVNNPGPDTYTDIPLFVILDVYGGYYFWPTFSDFDYREISVDIGNADIEVLPEFPWPTGVGNAVGINWYAAMTDPAITGLFGLMDIWTFGWTE
jgi:hypothetical protein